MAEIPLFLGLPTPCYMRKLKYYTVLDLGPGQNTLYGMLATCRLYHDEEFFYILDDCLVKWARALSKSVSELSVG